MSKEGEAEPKRIKVDGGDKFFNHVAEFVAGRVEKRFWPAQLKLERSLRRKLIFECQGICGEVKKVPLLQN